VGGCGQEWFGSGGGQWVGPCEYYNKYLAPLKTGDSSVAEQLLAYQVGLCSVNLITWLIHVWAFQQFWDQ